MPNNDPFSNSSIGESPVVEVWLGVGDSLRVGGSVLHVLDTEGDDAMLRVERVIPDDEDGTRWAELPR